MTNGPGVYYLLPGASLDQSIILKSLIYFFLSLCFKKLTHSINNEDVYSQATFPFQLHTGVSAVSCSSEYLSIPGFVMR